MKTMDKKLCAVLRKLSDKVYNKKLESVPFAEMEMFEKVLTPEIVYQRLKAKWESMTHEQKEKILEWGGIDSEILYN